MRDLLGLRTCFWFVWARAGIEVFLLTVVLSSLHLLFGTQMVTPSGYSHHRVFGSHLPQNKPKHCD